MYRIKRRLLLLFSFICILVFLTIYIIINYAAPEGIRKPENMPIKSLFSNIKIFDNKLEKPTQIEKEIIYKQDHVENQSNEYEIDSHEAYTGNEGKSCNNIWQASNADIQMLNIYDQMSFVDVDGGAWKQGWDIKYDSMKYNDHHKLKVFVVPHSHNDPGWIKTFEDYYEHNTKHILSNALRHLRENPDMKFIWAEISYFSRFFEDIGDGHKQQMKKIVQNNQLEFVTGGWVMPDEANSHWYSIIMQLTEGQAWLKKHFNVTPISSWSIDPFGHSATMPYILKKSGFQNLLIQRTHYSVKKELALKKYLEFNWKQFWDHDGDTELFTHMMPFYSYDIPHTCGPDPKICCQFDFKRMHGFGLSCPWRVAPVAIDDTNVEQRADLLVDQWKKKAELYRTNVVLIPLGDDFRYSQSMEWDVQRINYEKLFDHINAERSYFTEAKFGTLQEYFDTVHQEARARFPTLTGDFFTYADRTDNYWSGYYTSRPFHKRMDRILLHYIRSAEIISAWCSWGSLGNFNHKLDGARKELSLFQHHDGITGTAKTHVVEDYERRMLNAIKDCQFVMQQAAYRLLTKPSIYNADYAFHYFYLDDARWQKGDESRITIILGDDITKKYVVVHNSLPKWREETVEFYVSRPYMSVQDVKGNPIQAQISLVWSWHRYLLSQTVTPQASTTKYRLLFKARVPPFGMTTYVIILEPSGKKPSFTTYASDLILTSSPTSINIGDYPEEVKFSEHQETEMMVGDGPRIAFSKEGFIKSITKPDEKISMPVNISFYKYGTRAKGDRSGAYLFLPNGPAVPIVFSQKPIIVVSKGLIESSVSVGTPFGTHKTILKGQDPEIQNFIDIRELNDAEIVMKISTNIKNEETFYTDLNGLQIIKRKRYDKLPLQGNYYPIPAAIYIEDDSNRLTVTTGQPLGGSSLANGEIEIMQDRRLSYDDERGLGQGVMDNIPVLHVFRLTVENIANHKNHDRANKNPTGFLTLKALEASKSLLYPLDKLVFAENEWVGVQESFGADRSSLPEDLEIVSFRELHKFPLNFHKHHPKETVVTNLGLIIHRKQVIKCEDNFCSNGKISLKNFINLEKNLLGIYNTSLTFLKSYNDISTLDEFNMCPMDTQAFVVQYRH